MSTPAQIAANRKNAQQSTGPRTEAGKERSSGNALKHGGYSPQLLLPDEGAEDFARLQKIHLDHFRPTTELEKEDVHKLAILEWRSRRLIRAETEILTLHGLERDYDGSSVQFHFAGAGWAFASDCTKAKALPALSQIDYRLSRQIERLKKRLDENLARRAATTENDSL